MAWPYDEERPSGETPEERDPNVDERNFIQSLVGDQGIRGVSQPELAPRTALAGGGSINPMLALLPMLAQMQQAQTPFAQGANAFLNGLAIARGQAPMVQQPQAPSQYQQFQMIHELMKDQALEKERASRLELAKAAQGRLVDEAERRRIKDIDAQAYREGQFQWVQSKAMLSSNDPRIRKMAATNLVAAGRKLGFDPGNDDEAIQAFSDGELTHEDLNKNALDAARGVDVSGRRGMTPGVMASIQQPGGLVSQLLEDDTVARKKKAAEANIAEAQLIEHKNPEFFKASPDVIGYIQKAARDRFGMTYDQLDEQQKQQIYKTGLLDAKTAKMEEYKAQQDVLFQKQAALAKLHGQIQLDVAKAEGQGMFAPVFMDKSNVWVDGKTGMPIEGADLLKTAEQAAKSGKVPLNQKQADVVNAMERGKQELANMRSTWQEMIDRNLFSGSGNWPTKGPLGAIVAPLENFYKGTVAPKISPTDSDRAVLKAFDASKTALINIDRQLGTLGVRAFGAYGPQLETLSPTTGKEGVALTLSQVEDALDAQVKVQKLPGVFAQERIWTPPQLKGAKTPPPPLATGAPDLSKPPMSRMTFNAAAARLRAGYPPDEAEGRIEWLRQNHRITD